MKILSFECCTIFYLVLTNFFCKTHGGDAVVKKVEIMDAKWKIEDFIWRINYTCIKYGNQNLDVAAEFKTKFDSSAITKPGLSGVNNEDITFGIPDSNILDLYLRKKGFI